MKILGIDLGLARTGLAISDISETLASPVTTIEEKDETALICKIIQTAQEQKAERMVVGYPRNMDGTSGESAQRAEGIAHTLEAQSGIETVLWDERMTTVSAANYLNQTNTRGKKRKAVIDTVAATIILQDYLDSLKLKH